MGQKQSTQCYRLLFKKIRKKDLDKYFGIQRDNDDDNKLMIGDKEVTVDENSDIFVDNFKYNGTPGLWSLIMLAARNENSYTKEDAKNYRDLVKRTKASEHPRGVQGNSRPAQTYKRRRLFSIDDENSHTEEGVGIQFLPGDIKGLKTKLNLLLAEFAAGNGSSTKK